MQVISFLFFRTYQHSLLSTVFCSVRTYIPSSMYHLHYIIARQLPHQAPRFVCRRLGADPASPLLWIAERHLLAGFANTLELTLSICNSELITIGIRISLVTAQPLRAGMEVFAFYERID